MMPVSDLSLQGDLKGAARFLSDLERDQMPFATAVALTRTIGQVQVAVEAETQHKLVLRTPWTLKGIRITPANKKHLEATLYTKDWYMAEHEEGALRKPLKAPVLWMPTNAARQGGTKQGRIIPKFRPAVLGKFWSASPPGKGGSTKGRKKKATLKLNPFPAVVKGIEGVWRRQTEYKADGVKLLYRVGKTQDIRPVWGAEERLKQVVERNLVKNFHVAMDQAVKGRKK